MQPENGRPVAGGAWPGEGVHATARSTAASRVAFPVPSSLFAPPAPLGSRIIADEKTRE